MAQEGIHDIGPLVERLTLAMQSQSEELARLTHKPKIPTWIFGALATLALMVIGGFTSWLVTYGALENRVTTLEARTQSIDRLNSLDAKVDLLTGTVQRMETRFNQLMDGHAKDR